MIPSTSKEKVHLILNLINYEQLFSAQLTPTKSAVIVQISQAYVCVSKSKRQN